MNLKLHISEELEAKLVEQAIASGKRPEDIAMAALKAGMDSGDEAIAKVVSVEEWCREFDAWVLDRESRNARVDDSRESIYTDRL